MHRIITWIFPITLCFSATFGQSTLRYGVSGLLNTPVLGSEQADLSRKLGFGGSLFVDHQVKRLVFSYELQLNQLRYINSDVTYNLMNNRVDLMAGAYLLPLHRFQYGISVRAIASVHQDARTAIGFQTPRSTSTKFNQLEAGISLSLVSPMSDRIDLRMNYNTYGGQGLFKSNSDHLQLGLYYNFNVRRNKIKETELMSLSLDSLAHDTLYVVNAACSERMTDSLLNALFLTHFDFSPIKVIREGDVDSVIRIHHPLYFAYVGELYGGLEEPVSHGIYLMDRKFNLTSRPYPVHTQYYSSLFGKRPCFSSAESTQLAIKTFNRRLKRSL